MMMQHRTNKLIAVSIEQALADQVSAEMKHDRELAIQDLLEANDFNLNNGIAGPYKLHISSQDQRLKFEFSSETNVLLYAIGLSLNPFRRVVKDYFQICDSYNMAVKASNPQAIEAIDMARRAIHNEGSETLQTRFKGKAEMDFDTARRLFTLVCALTSRAN
jgi:uncharacterized protein (UPF0262 family)